MLEGLNIDGKDLRAIANIYWEQTVRVETKRLPTHKKECEKRLCPLTISVFNIQREYHRKYQKATTNQHKRL